MSKFKVGDRVIATEDYDNAIIYSLAGKVTNIQDHSRLGMVTVEFDRPFSNKTGTHVGHGPNYRSWTIPEDKLVHEQAIPAVAFDFEVADKMFSNALKLGNREVKPDGATVTSSLDGTTAVTPSIKIRGGRPLIAVGAKVGAVIYQSQKDY